MEQDFLKGLNPSQAEAVSYGEGPLLVLAGPGSGKTRVIAHRIAYLIKNNGVSPREILAVTFTNKAAREMKKRVETLAGVAADGLRVGTFHSVCIEIIRKEADFLSNYTKKFVVNPPLDDQKKIISDCISNLNYGSEVILPEDRGGPFDLSRFLTPRVISKLIFPQDALERFEKAENNGEVFFENNSFTRKRAPLFPDGVEESAFKYDSDSSKLNVILHGLYQEELAELETPYKSKKLEDFYKVITGLLTQVLEALYDLYKIKLTKSNAMTFNDLLLVTNGLLSENETVLSHYQNRFSHVFVDEYQDTNVHQYRFVELICRRHQNLCVVGDEDQSIYGWRGADARNILGFEEDFKNSKVVKLEQNYRSTKKLVAAASETIKKNRYRKEKNLWTENQEGENISVFRAFDENDEARFIAHRISELAESEKFAFNEMAVLYRINKQSRVIEKTLSNQKIPYTVVGARKFYKRKEIKHLLTYLRLIHDPLDWKSFREIINIPPRGIGRGVVDQLRHISQGSKLPGPLDTIESCEKEGLLPSITLEKLNEFSNLVNKLCHDAQKYSAGQIIEKLVILAGYLEYLEGDEDATENVEELIEAAKADGEPSVPDFLDRVALELADDEVATSFHENNKVSLMTIHKAKGLEFSAVFLAGLNEGLLPLIRKSDETLKGIEEERRLFYVAITRAKNTLCLTCRVGERDTDSRFLQEIPSEHIYQHPRYSKSKTENTVTLPPNLDLHVAALDRGDIEVIGRLIENGADVNAKENEEGMTAIHVVSMHGNKELAAFLVGKGADIKAEDDYGRTCLHLASVGGEIELVSFLTESGSDMNAKDEDGRTPLHIASLEGDVKLASFFVKNGADINAENKDGESCLDIALLNEHAELVSFLRDNGANRGSRNKGAN